MNAVKIEEEVSELAGRPFSPAEFPYEFLTAFDNADKIIIKAVGAAVTSELPDMIAMGALSETVRPRHTRYELNLDGVEQE